MSSSSAATDAFIRELNDWKLAGAVAWHGALFALGGAVWLATGPAGALLSLRSWLALSLVYAGLLGVLYCQRRTLTTLDVPPLYVASLGWSGGSWPSLLLSRCLLRNRTVADAADVAALYAACAGSAALAGWALRPAAAATGARQQLVYAVVLGLMYGVGYLIRAKNVLSFPILQRHRYFRIKQRMRALVRSSLLLPTLALLPALLACRLLGQWPGGGALLAAWRAGVLCVYGWAAGGHVLEVVFTEAVALAADDDPAPTAPVLAALQHKDPVVQDWVLRDLAAVAEGAGGARRAAIFDDETGASGWVPLSRYCLAELRDFVAVMAGALPSVAGAAASGAGVRWNVLQLTAGGARAASQRQDAAMWHLRARHGRLVLCMRVLSGLSAVGLVQDRFGLLQLAQPNLGDVLAALLGVVSVLSAYVKHASSIPVCPASPAERALQRLLSGGGSGSGGGDGRAATQYVDAASMALLDAAKTATYRVTNAYGPVLAGVVGGPSGAAPLVGSAAEAAALLAGFLDHAE